ncbi:glycerophosphodiester phosphodiesterase family protein [Granulosicoccus sp.]|nr:glycerophosphodiester phosphodiesterase family protein [Granulosicoccus sp.]MDB4224943.1 glycerophosphodiester phosphodiesterase family protein [Granulosicoccus sp.]
MNPWYLDRPIAHRGFHIDVSVPENSLLAFTKAMEKNYPIELDVRLSSDEHVLVFHDENLERMTGVKKYITEQTLKELKECRLDGVEQEIPTLKEVLELVRGTVPLVIELKAFNFDGVLEEKVYQLLEKYSGEFSIQSFDPRTLEWFYRKAPKITRGLLSNSFKGVKLGLHKKVALKYFFLIKKARPDYIGYAWDELDALGIACIRRFTDIPIVAWTVTNPDQRDRIQPYCHNIIFENFDV